MQDQGAPVQIWALDGHISFDGVAVRKNIRAAVFDYAHHRALEAG